MIDLKDFGFMIYCKEAQNFKIKFCVEESDLQKMEKNLSHYENSKLRLAQNYFKIRTSNFIQQFQSKAISNDMQSYIFKDQFLN